MSKRTILLGVALGFCFALSGCGGSATDAVAPSSETPAATESDANGGEKETAPLNVEDAESPEGVVDAFFRSFFKGDDDGAFALLTSKAQEATREQFSAQASDTIKWKATKKAALDDGRVCVYVDVEDYTETGEIQVEELTFVLSDADGVWRVAGFSVGELAINFEERQIDAVAQEEDAFSTGDAVKMGQTSESVVR
ncbi:MAG: hypothetical protein IJE77_04765 [Thermoguttaceae bacterium]|nr:hypothetical protein [Thermoguttaceae bacterium]MBQ9800322.1 hypothetical protein [Thermoguttaceae bacterium]